MPSPVVRKRPEALGGGRVPQRTRRVPVLLPRPDEMEEAAMESSDSTLNLSLSEAWDSATKALLSPSSLPLSDSLSVLRAHGVECYLGGFLLEALQMRLSESVVPEFWSGLKLPENDVDERGRAGVLVSAFQTLLDRLDPLLRALERLQPPLSSARAPVSAPVSLSDRAHTVIRALLLSRPCPELEERVLEFYSRTFSVYMRQEGGEGGEGPEEGADGQEGALCAGCAVPTDQCWCREALEQLQRLSHVLCKLQLLEWVSSKAVTQILHKLIEQRMERHCRGEYERSFLMDFQEWLEQVLGWLRKVFSSEADRGLSSSASSSSPVSSQAHVLSTAPVPVEGPGSPMDAVCPVNAASPVDFPESKPAIEDLKFCLERTNQRQQLLTSLKTAFESRLLHPGVHTSDILTVYISAIKALRELDPSMVILQVACQPIRKYLRTREDTVRQIVAGLTGDAEGCTDLASELSRGDPVTLELQESDEEGTDPEEWTLDPTDAVPDKSGPKRRSSDIISLLVSIYGSKDIFIDEYRAVEIRNVELLKLRFGESHMHYYEVMLKDMADSRRINGNVREEESRLNKEEQPSLPLSAIILSSEFWPTLKEEKLELPPVVNRAMEEYTHRYEKLKAMRTLSWKPHLGSVTLDVELEDRTITNLTVSPIHAAIILHFQDKSEWSLEELSAQLGAPRDLVHRKLALWQQQGVLREEAGGRYSVMETGSSREKLERGVMLIDSDEERDSNTTTQSEQREEKLQLFWAYIQAMLTNLDSMTLERIHSMLRMFVATGPVVTEMDVEELEAFLQRKVREHQLIGSAGVYRLPKSK
ncbi:hypothetical protein NQD34_006184 [Periophthalmus magnuspinnatus]|nr:hypothetical protein NQD34_006184 [Periophthalmus magnuspinnatus]